MTTLLHKLSKLSNRLSSSLSYRADWDTLGARYLSAENLDPTRLNVSGRDLQLSFLPGEEEQIFELGNFFHEDSYGLLDVPPPQTILDVGTNSGLFSIAARARFPDATIHAYEPCPELQPILAGNLKGLDVSLHHQALGSKEGHVSLSNDGPSSFGVTSEDSSGDIQQSSLATAVERMGGHIDFVKLDCEGAEWDLFSDIESWKKIDNLTMEYHLWAGDRSLSDLVSAIASLGFHIRFLRESQTNFNGILWASRGVQGDFGRAK